METNTQREEVLHGTSQNLSSKKHVLHHGHNSLHECALHSLKGILLGFCGFVIPISIRDRKFSGARKGAALAALLGSFRSLDCFFWLIKQKMENKPSLLLKILKKYATGIAGGLSIIPVIMIDSPSILNSTMVIWIIVRALRSLVPSVPHGAVVIMCISAAQILSTWIRNPEELSPSYVRFLNSQGGKSVSQLNPFRQGIEKTTCIVHPGLSCTTHTITFFLQGLRRALPLYIPIHLLGFFLSRRKNVKDGLLNLLRSCAFLSAYCTLAWTSGCFFFRVFPGVTRIHLIACVWLSGLATLLEREGRQKELAAYCLTHALDSIYGLLKKRSLVKPNNFVSSLAVIMSFGIIMQHHHHQPDFISKMLFGIGMKQVEEIM